MATSSMDAAAASDSWLPSILTEVQQFQKDCERRYRFNNRWDVALTLAGFVLSIAVAAAGFFRPQVVPILGALVAAVLSAQKAFPFGQRAVFYRLLIGQAQNLATQTRLGVSTPKDAVTTLSILRLDFAQQLPRGSSANDQPNHDNGAAAA